MTNYRDKFLGNKTVKVNTKDLDRKEESFLNEELKKVSDSKMLQIEREIESSNFIFNFNKLSRIIRPNISHKDPSTFAFYGSAESYYRDAFDNITNNYPYDGSRNERITWAISASALDLLILQHAYPKSTGNVIISPGSYGTITSAPGSSANNYALTNNDKQYISFTGGPRVKSSYVESTRLGNNLALDPNFGNTVEFWIKKGGWGHATRKETILDVHTPSAASGSTGYGRFLVELNPGNTTRPIEFSYISASTGFINQPIGEVNALTKTSLADNTWRHVALTVGNHSGSLRARLYVNGVLNQTLTKAVTVGAVETSTSATLGALATTNHGLGGLGWGKLSGSLDDFRFWRTERNPKHVGTFYDKPVYGGTSKDNSNPELGVYYKFNEGITGTESVDSVVLDYSGRINNGTFVGFSAANRDLDSAITLSSATTQTEESDPIILPSHVTLVSKKKEYILIGSGHDRQNHSALVKSLPQWVYDEDVFGANKADSEMGILIQAISTEFDTIKSLIDNVLNINSKDTQDFFTATSNIQYENKYLLGCSDDFSIDDSGRRDNSRLSDFSLSKEAFFVETHPIINQTDYYEYFYSMSETNMFSQDTLEIRDKILKNVHKNLVHIYKTKGTEESFRNMIRCFGVGDDLIRLNVYGNNEEREIKSEAIYTSAPKKSISFEGKNSDVTIYQSASASDTAALSSIPANSLYTPWTVEASFLFPDNKNQATFYSETSLFGATSSVNNNFSFNVSAEKFGKKQVYFKASSSVGLFDEIKTSHFPEVYDGARWHLALRVLRDSAMTLSSSANTVPPYKIEFTGYQYDLDVLRNSFHLSSSITESQFQKWSSESKVFYAGAQRTDISGSLIKYADSRIVSLNVWSDHLLNSELVEHAMNPHTYGRANPQAISPHDPGKNILTRDTEILNWRFEDTAEPNASTYKIAITDFSSGSLDKIAEHGTLAGSSYPAVSTAFADTKNAIIQEHFPVVEYVEVDNAYTSDRVKIKDGEFERFSIDSRPLTYTFSFEKSMYQVISKEMLNFVAGISSFNNILGEPVNKYRQDYKALQKLNDRFFSRVDSGIDLDKFVEYYKWIDASLGSFLTSIQPANSRMRTDLKNVVESHALERNKYQHPFPTVEFKTPNIPTAPLLGINELLYDWEHGHAPNAGEVYGARRTIFTFNVSTLSTSDIAVDENLDIGDGTQTVRFTFKSATGTTPFNAAGALEIGTGGSRPIALVTAELASKITASALTIKATSSGNQVILIHDHPSGLISVSEDHEGSDCILGSSQGLFTHEDNQVDDSVLSDNNCLWQKDRREHTVARNNIRDRIVTEVSGSTYVLRKLTKPYKYSVDRQDFLSYGSNRKANKIKEFYKIINSGKEISMGPSDVYEFRKCDDIIDPQRERVYVTKANTEGTSGYLDADGDLLFPFTLYSSSAGVDFSVFKKQMSLNNNHDDVESSWAQSPFNYAHQGGMPHRRVPFGTADKDRPEAYEISASATKFAVKQPSLYQKPKSMFYRDSSAGRLMSVANIKHTTGSLLLGNYTKDYEIVMTNGRRENNNYFVDNEGAFLITPEFAPSNYILGDVDFAVPNRGRTEHVIVNRFSAPGGPDSMGPAGLDRLSEEYSINDTINYRNSMVRNVWNTLSGEYSALHGYRTGSSVQASVHMTNRNPMHFTGALGRETNFDNFFVQHPVPQNDFGYSWITASAEYDVYNFLNKNANAGHQHMFNIPGTTMESSQTIPFLTSSEVGTYVYQGLRVFGIMNRSNLSDPASYTPADFVGINSNIYEPISSSTNILGYPSFDVVNKVGNNDYFEANYLNQDYVSRSEELVGSATTTAHPSKYAGEAAILNSIILHRQGPYGWPSWKQIRGGNHPIIREHRKNNTFSILKKGEEYSAPVESEYRHTYFPEEEEALGLSTITEARVVKNYKDISTTSRFKPIIMTKHKLLASTDTGNSERRSLIQEPEYGAQLRERSLWNSDQYYYELASQGGEGSLTQQEARAFDSNIYNGTISMRMTLPNDVTTYSNRQIIKDFDLEEMKSEKRQNFMKVLSTWFPSYDISPGASVVDELREVNYIETLYPKEINTYTKNSRTRQDFVFHGWNSTRANRQVFLSGNIGYTGTGTYTKQPNLVAFPEISILNDEDYLISSMGRVDMVNLASTASLTFGSHITASTWVLDARKDFTSLPVSIDLSFNTGKEVFLSNNSLGSRGEGLFQNDYGIYAMGHNAIHGTPPISMTYNRRVPQEVTLLTDDFETGTLGQNPTGWTPNGTLTDYNVRSLQNSEGNRILAFIGSTTSNQRFAQLGTTLTGSALVRFNVMAGGGQLDTDYGFAATGGSTSQRTPDDGDTIDVQYKPVGGSTWRTVAQIPYEASMKTTFKYCEALVPVSPTATWNLRFYQTNVPGGYHDKWGIDNLELVSTVLSGEAKFQTADTKLGPFYDSYEEYRDEIKRVGQDHSIVPEFKISDFVEEYYDPLAPSDTSRMRNEFLSLTGAIYHSSSGDLQVGSQFFKTYGNSEFMKYFSTLEEELGAEQEEFSATRLTLRCQAAMKFLPYKGFFPAERVQQIGEIFARSYMPSGSYSTKINSVNAVDLTTAQKNHLLDRRLAASKQQVMKPFFGPGVLNNSIKSGLAVDYPLFSTNYDSAISDFNSVSGSFFLTGSAPKTSATAQIHHYTMYNLTNGDQVVITSTDGDSKTYTARAAENKSSREFKFDGADALTSLRDCILDSNGHNGKIAVEGPSTSQVLGYLTVQSLLLTQATKGSPGNIPITSIIGTQGSLKPLWHTGFSDGSGDTVITGITGSMINSSTDFGVPRLSGSVSRRISFDDMLYAEDLYGQSIPDNEPHPSASLFYGNSLWNKVIERAPTFGKLNKDLTRDQVGIDFDINRSTFGAALTPFKSAIHNFASETVSFFLKDQQLETIMTPPVKLEIEDEKKLGQEYKMRVYLQNANTTMYDRHSAFGPAVDDGENNLVFYERGAPVMATAPITIATSPAALGASKTGVGQSAPSASDLEANPSITMVPIDGNGDAGTSTKVFFFDPANYSTTRNIPEITAVASTGNISFRAGGPAHVTGLTNKHEGPAKAGGQALSSVATPNFSYTDKDGSPTCKIHYVDPLDYVRFSTFDTALVYPELDIVLISTGASSYDLGFNGSNAVNFPGFDLAVSTGGGAASSAMKIRFYDSTATTGGWSTTTGYNTNNAFGSDGNAGGGTIASRNTTTSPHTFYINVNGLSVEQIKTWLNYQVQGYLGSDWQLSHDSGVSAGQAINFKYQASDQPNKVPAILNFTEGEKGSSSFFVFIPTLGTPNPVFSSYQAVQTLYRAQWTGTNTTNHVYGGGSSLQQGWVGPSPNIYSGASADSSNGRADTSDHKSLRDTTTDAFISVRQLMQSLTFSGSTMPVELQPVSTDAVSIDSYSGNYALAFDGARATLAGSPTYSYASTSSVPDSSTTYNGYKHKYKITAPFIYVFDFLHADSSGTSEATNYNSAFTNAGPESTYNYKDSYAGYAHTNPNDHMYAQYSTDNGTTWYTIMEIAPSEAFKSWTTGGFYVGNRNSWPVSDGATVDIRIITAGHTNSNTDVWMIDNIKVYDAADEEGTAALATYTAAAINGSDTHLPGLGAAVTATTPGNTNVVRLVNDVAGASSRSYTQQNNFFTQVGEDVAGSGSVTGINGGVDFVAASSVTTFYDVTGSQPGHSSTIRYCAIRSTASAGSVYSTAQLRSQLKHEIDQLISGNGLQIAAYTEGTNKIILSQSFGGEKGNNATGPGALTVADGTGSDNVATKVLTSISDSVFTGGGQSTDVQPVTRSVPDMHGYMPYVPPYLDRNASPYVEYTFIPRENKTYNAIEIVDQLTASYVNFHKVPDNYRTNTNYKEAMSISASINLNEIISMERDRYIVDVGPDGQEIVEQNPDFAKYGFRWAMQPKWETPVHDFSDASPDALRLDTNTVVSAPDSPWKPRTWSKYYDELEPVSTVPYLTGSTGMWHQLGNNLRSSFGGYYLRIEDVGENGLASAVGFLDVDPATTPTLGSPASLNPQDLVQRSKQSLSVKLGKIASKKNIKEAVVAIPYYLNSECDVSFFDLDLDQYQAAKLKVEKLKDDAIAAAGRAKSVEEIQGHIETYEDIASIAGTTAESSIAYQLRMMERYILPPVFDFKLIDDEKVLKPFVMYFFEFNAELDEKDLSNIWQNLYPESPGSTASPRYSDLDFSDPSRDDVVYSSHILDSSIVHKLQGTDAEENLSNYKEPGKFIENETRWLVFKCKYRAESDFSFIKDKSIEPTIFFERKAETIGRRPSLRRRDRQGAVNLPISYNWPYDYFSFVELIKLESKVDFYAIGKTPKPRNPRRGS